HPHPAYLHRRPGTARVPVERARRVQPRLVGALQAQTRAHTVGVLEAEDHLDDLPHVVAGETLPVLPCLRVTVLANYLLPLRRNKTAQGLDRHAQAWQDWQRFAGWLGGCPPPRTRCR